MNRSLALTIAVLFSALLLPAGGQEQKQEQKTGEQREQSFKLSVGANLVLVPVVVTEKGGKHITGLKREDFEIKEGGATQTISRVDELSAEAAKVQMAAGDDKHFSNEVNAEHPKKMEIIAIDRVNTTF